MDRNKFDEIELKMLDLDFGEKLNICTYRTPGFYLELSRGNYKESSKIIIDDKIIKIISYNGLDIIKEDEINDLKLINKIKKIVIKNEKRLIDLSLKLNSEYIMKHGKENSYFDSMLIKIDNFIFRIDNGSVQYKEANKMFNLVYSEVLKN